MISNKDTKKERKNRNFYKPNGKWSARTFTHLKTTFRLRAFFRFIFYRRNPNMYQNIIWLVNLSKKCHQQF